MRVLVESNSNTHWHGSLVDMDHFQRYTDKDWSQNFVNKISRQKKRIKLVLILLSFRCLKCSLDIAIDLQSSFASFLLFFLNLIEKFMK